MKKLDELAKRLDVLEKNDKNEFQRRARILQSLWRDKQGYPMGEHRGRSLGSTLAMPWAKESLANFLDDTIRDVVRREVLDKENSKGKLYGKPRIFSNLLSSQPLAFNLFAHLQQDLSLATKVLGHLTEGRCAQVTAIEFEQSPGRGDERYTGDKSAFDVYVLFTGASGEKGFIGIEVKYHESLNDSPSEHKPRYDEVAELMGCFAPEHIEKLKQKPLQQIWRDHLLAGSHKHVDGFDDGLFVLLYPEANEACDKAAKDYKNCLSCHQTYETWTLEQFRDALDMFTDASWVSEFTTRYLNREIDGQQGPTRDAMMRMVQLLPSFEKNMVEQVPTFVVDGKQCFRPEHKSIQAFVQLAYDDDWVFGFDWARWDEGREIASDPTRVADADMLTIRKLITALVRNERFCEGALQDAYEGGLLMAVILRVQKLHSK